MRSAEELHLQGMVAVNAGRLGQAQRLLATARERTMDPALLARIDATAAYVAADTQDPDVALRLLDRALNEEQLRGQHRGVLLCQRALILRRTGNAISALDAFGQAIELLAEAPLDLAKAQLNRGTVHLDRGDPQSAASDFESAAANYNLTGDAIARAKAEHNLGYARFLAGDLVGALRAMEQAHVVLEPVSPVVKATCEQDRAEVLLAAGLVSEGVRLLHRAAADYGRRRMRQRQAEAELALAINVQPFDARVALTAARSARRRFRALSSDVWRARAEAQVVAAEVSLGGTAPRLVATADAVAEELSGLGLPWRVRSAELDAIRVLARRADLDGAAVRLGAPMGTAAPLALRIDDCDVRAEVDVARGRPTRALEHLRTGLTALHSWQSSFGSLDLQTGVAGHGVRLAARGLALAVESRRPEVLFEWSERARMLASRVQPVRAPEDEQIVADLTELRGMVAEGGQRDPAREAELRQRVRERAWQHRGSGEVADPVTLDALRPALDGEALVAYVVAADRVVALVATSDDVTRLDLGGRAQVDALLGGLLPDLDMAAAELPEAMAGFVRAELAGRLAGIAATLVEPLLAAVGERAVVLTPSGVLAGVPWTLLPGFTGRPVTVAQSATSWLARRTTPLRSATAGLVAGPRVARAEDEVTAAAKEWDGARLLTGEVATAGAVSELASTVDVLHVAAHGRHSSENAMFSGLQLADGPWFGYDIDQLRQVPDVVLLSACEVGRSTVRWGDELIGMTTAWLHAGARRVIASAAAVNDRAAYDVLVTVHQQLVAGVDPAVALAAAVPAVSADTAPVPLVCFG
ncbi:CHAT domain-containing protein [Nocardioides sp. URHA0032]|uniref:CHAT domain-containing protein n=1 Tax=Nocardioides sp. URHA0032 TaxID=1380388 RepID=UPI0012DE46F0|nr:CHAT domain-containing protein [Nocardioides sp. URHA0032]